MSDTISIILINRLLDVVAGLAEKLARIDHEHECLIYGIGPLREEAERALKAIQEIRALGSDAGADRGE